MSDYRNEFRRAQRDYYWTLPRAAVALACGVACLGAVVFGINYAMYGSFSFFAPRYEAVRRDQMIESRAYTEGTIRELYTIKRQYEAATTDEQRATLAAAARHEFSIFPKERLPLDLQGFLAQIGG